MTASSTSTGTGLRRATGGLFVAGAITFAVAATVLSSTFDWPDILREPAGVVLPAFAAGGTEPGVDVVRHRLDVRDPGGADPAVAGRRSGRRHDQALRVATLVGAASVVLALIGFLRWVFVVPPLARSYVDGDATTQAAVDAAWTAQHQFGGALLGRAPGPTPGHRLVGHPVRGHPAQPGAAPLARRHRARWSAWSTWPTRATSWPPPSPASRSGTWPACSAAPAGGCGWPPSVSPSCCAPSRPPSPLVDVTPSRTPSTARSQRRQPLRTPPRRPSPA